MPAKIITNTEDNLNYAANIIKQGGVIAFPTETVYGLGCDIKNAPAIERIYKIKQRSYAKPLTAHISNLTMVEQLIDIIPDTFYDLAHYFLPGPLTIIMQAGHSVSNMPHLLNNTLGIRYPSDLTATALIEKCATPIAATSANISGNNPATCANEVIAEMKNYVDVIIDAGDCVYKVPSTIINLVPDPVILRQGAISISDIETKLGRKIRSI